MTAVTSCENTLLDSRNRTKRGDVLKKTWCLSKIRSAGVMYSKGFKVSSNQLFFFFLSFSF